MSGQNEIDYITPTEPQISARRRRSYAIGGALLAFTLLVFALMIVKLGSMSGGNAAELLDSSSVEASHE